MYLLSACRSHENIVIEEFMDIIFFGEPQYFTYYIILSNIYFDVGNYIFVTIKFSRSFSIVRMIYVVTQ